MKKPEHLTFENYQGANSSHERSALVAEVFQYATKLEENFKELVKHLDKGLAGLKMELAILDKASIEQSFEEANKFGNITKRGYLNGKIDIIENTLFLLGLDNALEFKSNLCPRCGGTGEIQGPEPDDVGLCLHCMGTGIKAEETGYTHTMKGFDKSVGASFDCPSCGGTGVEAQGNGVLENCPTCDGAGTIEENPQAILEPRKTQATRNDVENLIAKLVDIDSEICGTLITLDKGFTLDIRESFVNDKRVQDLIVEALSKYSNLYLRNV